jgi:hypothetical protein
LDQKKHIQSSRIQIQKIRHLISPKTGNNTKNGCCCLWKSCEMGRKAGSTRFDIELKLDNY